MLAWVVAILYCSEFQKEKAKRHNSALPFSKCAKMNNSFSSELCSWVKWLKVFTKGMKFNWPPKLHQIYKRSFLFHYQRKLVLLRPVALNPVKCCWISTFQGTWRATSLTLHFIAVFFFKYDTLKEMTAVIRALFDKHANKILHLGDSRGWKRHYFTHTWAYLYSNPSYY